MVVAVASSTQALIKALIILICNFTRTNHQRIAPERLNRAGLTHADLSGSKLTAYPAGGYGDAVIDFGEANLANADLSGSELHAVTTGPDSYGKKTATPPPLISGRRSSPTRT